MIFTDKIWITHFKWFGLHAFRDSLLTHQARRFPYCRLIRPHGAEYPKFSTLTVSVTTGEVSDSFYRTNCSAARISISKQSAREYRHCSEEAFTFSSHQVSKQPTITVAFSLNAVMDWTHELETFFRWKQQKSQTSKSPNLSSSYTNIVFSANTQGSSPPCMPATRNMGKCANRHASLHYMVSSLDPSYEILLTPGKVNPLVAPKSWTFPSWLCRFYNLNRLRFKNYKICAYPTSDSSRYRKASDITF